MKGYGQFCPVAKAVEVLAERWTLLVVRELLGGARRFNDIHRGVPLMSPSLLTQRLRTLERAGLLERRAGNGRGVGYHLTEAGEELRPVVALLGMWGQRWVRSHYTAGELDAGLLLWDVRRFVAPRGLGDGRVVVNFLASATGPPASGPSGWSSTATMPTCASSTPATRSTWRSTPTWPPSPGCGWATSPPATPSPPEPSPSTAPVPWCGGSRNGSPATRCPRYHRPGARPAETVARVGRPNEGRSPAAWPP